MSRLLAVVAVLLAVSPLGAARQDSMVVARELYATAAYDEALAMLDRLRAAAPAAATAESRTIEQFRAYCLFALNRTTDAEKAVETVVSIDPTWEIADTEAPPRIVALFTRVRARALTSLIRGRFNDAKALYAARKHDESVAAFTSLLQLLDHQGVMKAAGADLADLKTVSIGFRDLAKAAAEQALRAAAPPPAPPPTEATPVMAANGAANGAATPVSGGPSSVAAPAAASGGGSQASDKSASAAANPVLPPSIITQQIPRPMGMAVPLGGESVVILDVLIDELGRVERAAIRQSANRAYEAQLLAASRSWRYTPATQSGKPVKYVKTIEVTLTAR
jgi:TonB family protein